MGTKENITQKLNVITGNFGRITIAEMTESRKGEILFLLQEIERCHYGDTIHFGIERSKTEIFFNHMEKVIYEWSKKEIFSDRQVLRTVAQLVIDIFLGKERVRDFESIENGGLGRRVYHPDAYHISCCESEAGDFLLSLGFFEDALDLFNKSVCTAKEVGQTEIAWESMFNLAKKYLKTDHKSVAIDKMICKLTSRIVKIHKRKVVQNILDENHIEWIDHQNWDRSIKGFRFHEQLAELGHDEAKQLLLLKSVYRAAVRAIKDFKLENVAKDSDQGIGWNKEIKRVYEQVGL